MVDAHEVKNRGAKVMHILKWAVKQRLEIKEWLAEPDPAIVQWFPVFSEAGPTPVDGAKKMSEEIESYLSAFTSGNANKLVRNCNGDGFEAWRRLAAEYDPTSAMRRVAILRQVQHLCLIHI